jgi:hypothetical protein
MARALESQTLSSSARKRPTPMNEATLRRFWILFEKPPASPPTRLPDINAEPNRLCYRPRK